MITYIKGDLLKADADVLVHGCNCFTTMGAGVAVAIKKHYPGAYASDLKTEHGDVRKLGTYSSWTGPNCFNGTKTVTVVNAYTQYEPSPWKKPFDYEAFEAVLNRIKVDFADKIIAMPKIGSGLAGGDWDKISEIIEKVFPDKEIKVYYID